MKSNLMTLLRTALGLVAVCACLAASSAWANQQPWALPESVTYEFPVTSLIIDGEKHETTIQIRFSISRQYGGAQGSINGVTAVVNGIELEAPLSCLKGLSWPIDRVVAQGSEESLIALISTKAITNSEDRRLVRLYAYNIQSGDEAVVDCNNASEGSPSPMIMRPKKMK